jgi:hypothetical protein
VTPTTPFVRFIPSLRVHFASALLLVACTTTQSVADRLGERYRDDNGD